MLKLKAIFLFLLLTAVSFGSVSVSKIQDDTNKKKSNGTKKTKKKSYSEVILPDGNIKCTAKDGTVSVIDPAEIAGKESDSNCKMNIVQSKSENIPVSQDELERMQKKNSGN